MNIIGALIVLAFVCLAIWIIYEIAIAIYHKTALRYETTRDVAKVVEKNYDDNYAMQIATKTYPLGLYDEYNVYIWYNGKKYCFDDENLYKKVKVGATVHILIHNGYNKHGELKHSYLSIEK
jgi:hypothetical protein